MKTQETMQRGSRKRSPSARSEKMERVGERQEKIERYCATGQSPQRAIVPIQEERRRYLLWKSLLLLISCMFRPKWAIFGLCIETNSK